MKEYDKVKGFRLGKSNEKLLTDSFELLNIREKGFSAKMNRYIPQCHRSITELIKLKARMKVLQIKIERLEHANKPKAVETHKKPKPETSIEKDVKAQEVQENLSSVKDDWLVCPDRDDWVKKSVDCKTCSQEDFQKFKEC